MAVTLQEWLDGEHATLAKKSVRELSEHYFHRVEMRAKGVDSAKFFTPADGVITSAHERINANSSIINVKGKQLSVKDLLQDNEASGFYTVVGVFMTFYSQHQNYMPYAGLRTYEELAPLSTFNKPMLKVEKEIINGIVNPEFQHDYLKKNGREISEVYAPKLGQNYQMARIADYDVDSFVNWSQPDGEVTTAYQQNDRFGMITFGSATFLIIKNIIGGPKFKIRKEATVSNYVKCCYDAIIDIE